MDYAIIEPHIPRLRRYARALTGDRTRADDLVQDTLERAMRKLALWRRGSDLRAWLFTLMHNVYINQRRAERPTLPWDDALCDTPQGDRQEGLLIARDLLAAIDGLPSEFREVVLLVGLEEFSYAETARVLGIPQGTVMSRLARGRERLRRLLDGEPERRIRRVK
ncbi:RNA polymerase subunit sigma-24 [Acidihalobacter yilgarnensis]|uniref:RNA polymerase subunit sigma-24 n=1 Tax=Acidihalobacter yilgarnensis TaxID=2819280 RepID=A0A1D8IKH9_9GAMM|nr:RNA polymerase sigma factor [Acidihalobacter yilgarnensis]AOU96968.1 RNA polymerase subunit sigma-24 [Acidihalobacter yilgarnensis]